MLTCPGSKYLHLSGYPTDALIAEAAYAVDFVMLQTAEGSDSIKIIADVPGPGPDQATLSVAVAEAKKYGKLTVAPAVAYEPVSMARKSKVDVLTHVPMDQAFTKADVESMVRDKRICIPTVAMMEGIGGMKTPGKAYEHSEQSVRTMKQAGVPILAGTDANNAPGTPSPNFRGDILQRELELLVNAGLSTIASLRCATEVNAMHLGLTDRGFIEPGR